MPMSLRQRITAWASLLRPAVQPRWSISLYGGKSPLGLSPFGLDVGTVNSVLQPDFVLPTLANGIADPFMVQTGTGWTLFFEIENRVTGSGEIGAASSSDGMKWNFAGSVLREPFHLSYPQVFEHQGQWFMLPEAAQSGGCWLYRALEFPLRWERHSLLIDEPLLDPTLFQHQGRWWLLALKGFRTDDELHLYHADHLTGPWQTHVCNPIVKGDRSRVRPAGRVIEWQGQLIRFSQDYSQHYGQRVLAHRILQLTPDVYQEEILPDFKPMGPSGSGWNATGMHHIDAHQLADGSWLACVDGHSTVKVWPFARKIRSRLHRLLTGAPP